MGRDRQTDGEETEAARDWLRQISRDRQGEKRQIRRDSSRQTETGTPRDGDIWRDADRLADRQADRQRRTEWYYTRMTI